MSDWSAKQYSRFETERNRPIIDLLAALPEVAVNTAIDIGCGPGNSTGFLAARFPKATITGIDSSPDMIAAAKRRLPKIPFSLADISHWQDPGPYDLIFCNAVLQWLPSHQILLPQLLEKIPEGGLLAAQMPDNLDEPAHRLMRETAAEKPWAEKLAGASGIRSERHSPDWYYFLLRPLCHYVDLWRTTYYHVLQGGASAIVEWFKGTGLRPFLARLEEQEKTAFLQSYQHKIAQAYPEQPDGSVILPFPRLFFIGHR